MSNLNKISNGYAIEDEDDEELHTSCGIGSWRPQWLQWLANPFFFMVNISIVGVLLGQSGSVYYSQSSTIEKRFGFDSKLTGLIMIMDNFAEIGLNPFISYLAVRYNRARLIAIGQVLAALSCFITASPYLFYGPATHLLTETDTSFKSALKSLDNKTANNFELCSADGRLEDCSEGPSVTVWPAVALLLLGSFVRGLGYTSLVVIGLPYLDDNTSKKKSPFYISILMSLRLIGPASGFMITAFCLRMYENPFMDPGIKHTDPRFVGAWWLAFVICGSLLLLASLPMFLFPAQFKNAPVKTKDIKKKILANGGSLGAFKRIVTNPLVMCCLASNTFAAFGLFGYMIKVH